ncbi:MAG: hypothetical protein ACJ79O_10595 [Myxococcales bacterium]
MHSLRVLPLAMLAGVAAARAERVEPVIDRPLIIPQGKVDATLLGTYTNWGDASLFGAPGIALTGESAALALDYGVGDTIQLGIGMALPLNPGFAFGSILGSMVSGFDPAFAMRVDLGYENSGLNGNGAEGAVHTQFFFAGIGVPLRVPITRTLAFVSGRADAVHFGHFTHVGESGRGFYAGASRLSALSSDIFVYSMGNNDSGSAIGINLPAGLLLQPDPHFAVTLLAGYSAVVALPTSGSAFAAHFVPVGLEASVTPVPALDIGARFSLDGYVAQTGTTGSEPGFFDLRALMLWLRFRPR